MLKPLTFYRNAKALREEVTRIHKTPEGYALLHRTDDADGRMGMAARELRALQETLNTFFADAPRAAAGKENNES